MIPEGAEYGYFATTNFSNTETSSKFLRVRLSDLAVEESVTMEGLYRALTIALDDVGNRGYVLGFDRVRNRNVLAGVYLDIFQLTEAYGFQTATTTDKALVIDSGNAFAYVGSAHIYKIRLNSMVLDSTINAVRGGISLRAAFVNLDTRRAYFGNVPSSGLPSFFGINMDTFRIAEERFFGTAADFPQPPTGLAVQTKDGALAYFAAPNGDIARIDLANPSARIDQASVTAGNGRGIASMAIDEVNGYLYLGTTRGSGQAMGIRLPLDWNCETL